MSCMWRLPSAFVVLVDCILFLFRLVWKFSVVVGVGVGDDVCVGVGDYQNDSIVG